MPYSQQDPTATDQKVINKNVSGTVIAFDCNRGFGCIKRADNGDKVFISCENILRPNPKHLRATLTEGESVEFDVFDGPMGHQACAVTGPGRAPVKGNSSYNDYTQFSGGANLRNGFADESRRPRLVQYTLEEMFTRMEYGNKTMKKEFIEWLASERYRTVALMLVASAFGFGSAFGLVDYFGYRL